MHHDPLKVQQVARQLESAHWAGQRQYFEQLLEQFGHLYQLADHVPSPEVQAEVRTHA
jgi:hypothetical protein